MRARRKCSPQTIFRISEPTRRLPETLISRQRDGLSREGCGFASSDPTTKGAGFGTPDNEPLNGLRGKDRTRTGTGDQLFPNPGAPEINRIHSAKAYSTPTGPTISHHMGTHAGSRSSFAVGCGHEFLAGGPTTAPLSEPGARRSADFEFHYGFCTVRKIFYSTPVTRSADCTVMIRFAAFRTWNYYSFTTVPV
jgi:hypothetical protein